MITAVLAKAQDGTEWDNPKISNVNREAAHTVSIPYGTVDQVAKNDMTISPYYMDLDGVWKFKWVGNPANAPKNVFGSDYKTGELRHRLFTLRKRYFDANSRYVQEEDDEEVIAEGDEKDRIAAEQKAREEAIARQKAAEAAMQYYVIKSGDTLSKIAARYHTSVNTLCRLNGMTVNTKLQIGKRIRVK